MSNSSLPTQSTQSFFRASVHKIFKTLAVLVVGSVSYMYLSGHYGEKLDLLRNSIRSNNSLTRKLAGDYSFAVENEALYHKLDKKGINRHHDRIEAVKLLDQLKKAHRLNRLSWEFSPAREHEIRNRYLKGKSLSKTHVKLRFAALLDSDVYAFIRDLQERIPGKVVIENVMLQRVDKFTPQLLTRIVEGNAIDIVKGELSFFWHMVEPEQ